MEEDNDDCECPMCTLRRTLTPENMELGREIACNMVGTMSGRGVGLGVGVYAIASLVRGFLAGAPCRNAEERAALGETLAIALSNALNIGLSGPLASEVASSGAVH